MGRIRDWAERSRASAIGAVQVALTGLGDLRARAVRQVGRTIDRDRWSTATDWRDRVAAVSWPRASIGGVLAAALVISLWMVLQPSGMRSHPPRLPTEQEWRAAQSAAEAMEADLSPALAAANRTVGAGDQP